MNDQRITTMVTNDNNNAASKNAPTVSVVMITYNHARYIEEAITSILKQDFSGSLELIIGDDCSTDITTNIVRHFHQLHPSKIKLIKSDSNVGMQANARRCIEACTGEYIAFCEGDDFWSDPEKLEKQIRILRSNPDVGAVHSDFSHVRLINGKWKALRSFNRSYRREIPQGRVFDQLLIGNFIQTCTLCVCAEQIMAFLNSELPIDSYCVGDWPLCLYISASHEIAYIDEPLATYRLTPNSITNSGHERDIARAENSMNMIDDFCMQYLAPERIRIQASNMAMKQILFLASISANTLTFEKYWHKIYLTDPAYLEPFRFQLLRFIVNTSGLRSLYACFRSVVDTIKPLKKYR